MKRERLLTLLKNVLKIGFSLFLIFIIIRGIDLTALEQVFRNANLGWLTLGLFLVFSGIFVRAWRWKILLDALKYPVPLGTLSQIYFIGFLFNNLLPTGLGGDAIRMVELNKYGDQRTSDAVTSVLVDRLLGLFGALVLALLALAFRWNMVPIEVAIFSLIIFGGIIGGGFVLISKPLYNTLRKIGVIRRLTDIKFIGSIFASFQAYHPRALWQSFLVSVLFNLLLIGLNMTIGLGLGAEVALVHYLVFVPIASLVLILPISFAGLGVREAAYVTLFTQVGVPEEVALGMSLLVYFLGNVIPGLVGGAIYLWRSTNVGNNE